MSESQNIKSIIVALEVGQSTDFPVERLDYVRVISSNAGLTLGRKYKTATKRDERVITVTREL